MKNIVILSHQGVASGLKRSAQMIVGEFNPLITIELTEMGVETFTNEVQQFLQNEVIDKQKEYLAFVDLKGGTPYNQIVKETLRLNLADKVSIISGVNLPLILEAFYFEEDDLTILEKKGKRAIEFCQLEMNVSNLDE
ncbi:MULTISPECIES: PTS sugar transporter subunit IIA [unclassified Niallia]|jgi:mannose/fructose-specific phosphotransferase system component IIA|uniref:PTS sugar transporter subunit IIA domain-containing protein n=1 Tax=unclassified Niallia TaxID=2837522 RepID=UPI0002FFD568